MGQLLTHILGDFCFQSDWMAMNKNKRTFPCLIHVIIYTSCFLLLTTSWKALLVIGATHFILDRYPIIIKRLIWSKNHLGPWFKYVPYNKCNMTGYYDNVANEVNKLPITNDNINGYTPRLNYVTVWLYIITDNFLHLTFNYLALTHLG